MLWNKVNLFRYEKHWIRTDTEYFKVLDHWSVKNKTFEDINFRPLELVIVWRLILIIVKKKSE